MKLSLLKALLFFLFIIKTCADDDIGETGETVEEPPAGTVYDIPYSTPRPVGNVYLAEHFDDLVSFRQRWILSEAKKDGAEESIAKYNGRWIVEEAEKNGMKGDLGLVLQSKAHHHAISARLDKPFIFDNKPFILQYEVHFQNGQDCGGAYLKLLSTNPDLDLQDFHDKTPYTIMFGPDKCGNDHKLHFIFRHKNPHNGTFQEKHWKKTSSVPKLEDVFKDHKPHLFTLVINPDNSFEVLVDQKSIQKGSLLEDFSPPVNPPSEIKDPTDKKPDDWDERERIPDPDAKKPDDWNEDAPRQVPDPKAKRPEDWLDDEPELVPDPAAEKPKDWDDDMDGEWEPPLIANPKCDNVGCGEWKAPVIDNPEYKGKWSSPMMDNPNYKGKWKPRMIPNPDYFEEKNPYKMTSIAAVGLELWSMSDKILFDNIIITDDQYVADQWAAESWVLEKEVADRETDNVLVRLVKYTNKHPWLWAVYIVVIGLPVVLFISFCCTTSPSAQEQEQLRRAKQKKTDEPVPDDVAPSQEDAKDDNISGDGQKNMPQDEVTASDAPDHATVLEDENEPEEITECGDDDDDVEDELNKGKQPSSGTEELRRSPRHRRPRRD